MQVLSSPRRFLDLTLFTAIAVGVRGVVLIEKCAYKEWFIKRCLTVASIRKMGLLLKFQRKVAAGQCCSNARYISAVYISTVSVFHVPVSNFHIKQGQQNLT